MICVDVIQQFPISIRMASEPLYLGLGGSDLFLDDVALGVAHVHEEVDAGEVVDRVPDGARIALNRVSPHVLEALAASEATRASEMQPREPILRPHSPALELLLSRGRHSHLFVAVGVRGISDRSWPWEFANDEANRTPIDVLCRTRSTQGVFKIKMC